MKIGTKTTFGKLKVGDLFSSEDIYDLGKIIKCIKTKYLSSAEGEEGTFNAINSVSSDGAYCITTDDEVVTYLGRGF